MPTTAQIVDPKAVADRIIAGGKITMEEAEAFIALEQWSDILALAAQATRIREKFTGGEVDLCALVNAKSGLCSEDCGFCSQSARYETDVSTYPMMSVEQILERARQAKSFGAKRFCIVAANRGLSDKDLPLLCEAVRRVKAEVGIEPECSLGFLTEKQLLALKAAGMTRYNHNLETSESHFEKVCTTHTYRERLETMRMVKRNGVETCCGGILGLGESRQQRLELAFELAELDVTCAPINVLNPRPGTPMEENTPPSPQEVVKTIAVFRFILPKAKLELGGGREVNLRDFQSMAFLAGANSLIIGGYLTTHGRQPGQDMKMLRDLGFTV
ncbi:MAG: biotin synthase BioB [Candidatus Omnitrophica bacterium CG11_big_fil_rev_8_21_14_0_20_64_10]|nr:MAG: biotin synthase BioB [Candidatus Omnitrophica bacterium CG11_big_fil_rev_8_21_14_0_20_64_10]